MFDVLGIFRKDLLLVKFPSIRTRKPNKYRGCTSIDVIGSAMELNEAGIRFKPSTTTSLQEWGPQPSTHWGGRFNGVNAVE